MQQQQPQQLTKQHYELMALSCEREIRLIKEMSSLKGINDLKALLSTIVDSGYTHDEKRAVFKEGQRSVIQYVLQLTDKNFIKQVEGRLHEVQALKDQKPSLKPLETELGVQADGKF